VHRWVDGRPGAGSAAQAAALLAGHAQVTATLRRLRRLAALLDGHGAGAPDHP
jgi:hypothetical protein